MQESQEKSRLQTILAQLSKDQLRFVVAMQEHKTKDAAAKALHLKPDTVYHWDVELIEEAINLMAMSIVDSAMEQHRLAANKAAAVRVAGLDSKNEIVRQRAAADILDRILGKVSQGVEVTGKDGGGLVVTIVKASNDTDEDND
jgi:hypothetical protein